MYKAFYRKYRPQTFSDICGQDHISKTLKNQIADNKISHAYLFCGSRGTGKTSSAKILAKAVNCLNGNEGDPCNSCEICQGIDNGSVLDVIEIDAASNNGVDNIRDLRDNIEFTPAKAKYRVYIIDEVHMLSTGAFNALLKTLEEPPEHAIFVLATTEAHKIPATVMSRCQRFDFNRIAADVIASRIKYVADLENLKCDDNAAMLIAKLADGGMRDALSMLDLCAGTNSSNEINEKVVIESVGLAGREHLFLLVDLIESSNSADVLNELDKLYQASLDMQRLCDQLIAHYRNVLVCKTCKNADELIFVSKDELEKIKLQAKNIKYENIIYAIQSLSECTQIMKQGTDKRIALEMTLIQLCVPSLKTTVEALNKRVSELEQRINQGLVVKEQAENLSDKQPKASAVATQDEAVKPVKNIDIYKDVNSSSDGNDDNDDNYHNDEDFINDLQVDDTSVDQPKASQPSNIVEFDKWPEVLKQLSGTAPVLHAMLLESIAYIDGEFILIDAKNTHFADLVNRNKDHRNSIRTAVASLTGKKYNLGPFSRTKSPEKKVVVDPLDNFLNEYGNDIEVE